MKQPPKSRNPMAKALANPLFRKRVVKSKKVYSRKGRRASDGPSPFLLVLVAVLGLSTPALAEDFDFDGNSTSAGSYVERDSRGRRVGTVEPGATKDQSVRRDTHGRRVGTEEIGPTGETVLRDNRGRRVGTREKSPWSREQW